MVPDEEPVEAALLGLGGELGEQARVAELVERGDEDRAAHHQLCIDAVMMWPRSRSSGWRGATFSSRCCLSAPSTSARDVVLGVAQLGDAARRADVAHERAQLVGQRVDAAHRLAGEQRGDVVVALGRALVGEAERGRRGDDHRVPVRDERVVVRVAGRLVARA